MGQPETYKFNIEFEHEGVTYVAYIVHTAELTESELKQYNIREHSFLVHLLEPSRFISFELFIGEDLEWQSNISSFLIDVDLFHIIGRHIDWQYT